MATATSEREASYAQTGLPNHTVEPDTHCNARLSRKKKLCTQEAGWGTSHPGFGRCKLHGGANPAGIKAALKQIAKQGVAQYGLSIETTPIEALMDELNRTAGHVAFLRLQVGELEAKQMTGPVGGGAESYPHYEANVWIRMYQAERKHLTAVAKTCIDAGIAERQVRIAEQQGQLFAEAIRGILKELGVGDDPRVPETVRKHLTLVAGEKAA